MIQSDLGGFIRATPLGGPSKAVLWAKIPGSKTGYIYTIRMRHIIIDKWSSLTEDNRNTSSDGLLVVEHSLFAI